MLLSIAGQEPKQDSRKMTRDLDAGRLSHICREVRLHMQVVVPSDTDLFPS